MVIKYIAHQTSYQLHYVHNRIQWYYFNDAIFSCFILFVLFYLLKKYTSEHLTDKFLLFRFYTFIYTVYYIPLLSI